MSSVKHIDKHYGLLVVSVLFGTALPSALPIARAECGSTPPCTITMDGVCPNAAEQCGALFVGGGGCQSAMLIFCYSTGLRSYRVDPATPLTITLSSDLAELTVFFASLGAIASGEMHFFNAADEEVGVPIETNGDCLLFMPNPQSRVFEEGVRTIEVTAEGGTVFIDTFVATLGQFPAGPPDFNDDCDVGPFDLAALLGAWGPCPDPCEPSDPAETCPTDLNGDCDTGPFDLATLLGAWGPQ